MKLSINSIYFFIIYFAGVISGVSQTRTQKLQLSIENTDSIQKPEVFLFNNYKEIDAHLTNTIDKLQEQGFLTAYFLLPKKTNDSTFVTRIFKNSETPYIYIKNYTELPPTAQAMFSLAKDNKNIPIALTALKQKIKQLNYELSEEGSPFNTIQLKNIKKKGDSLFADLKITKLKQRTLDSIIIKGYPKFPTGFLKYYAGLKTGNTYKNTKIESQSLQISNLTFVTAVKPAEVLFNPKSTQLYLYLKKQNANNFDGFLGFSTDEENGNVILDGYLNLNLINNLNFGEELRLTYKSDSE